jgi:hypothetical protein
MPVHNIIQKMFSPGKDFSIHDSYKSCDHRTDPKWDSLKKIVLQLFIMNIVEGFF